MNPRLASGLIPVWVSSKGNQKLNGWKAPIPEALNWQLQAFGSTWKIKRFCRLPPKIRIGLHSSLGCVHWSAESIKTGNVHYIYPGLEAVSLPDCKFGYGNCSLPKSEQLFAGLSEVKG